MTAQDWLDIMPIVAGCKWGYDDRDQIRDRNGRCPLCALAHEIDDRSCNRFLFGSALTSVGIQYGEDAKVIACAADDAKHPLRPALMTALGMGSEPI